MRRIFTYFTALIGLICAGFVVMLVAVPRDRTVSSDIIQGVLIGFGSGFVTAQVAARIRATRVNGWTTVRGLGDPRSGFFARAANAQLFPGPVNTLEEAAYWWTRVDGTGRALTGQRDYVMRFPPGGLPPNHAFWSLTMGDARNHFVPNPLNRYAVGDRSGLVPNAEGSVDVHLSRTAPAGREANWLPTPDGAFVLWLRVYEPGAPILDGTYRVPPVVPAPVEAQAAAR